MTAGTAAQRPAVSLAIVLNNPASSVLQPFTDRACQLDVDLSSPTARSPHSYDHMCTADQGVRVGGCRHCIVKPNTALSITRSGLSMRKPLSEVVLTGEPAGLSVAGRSPARRCSSSPRSMSLCWTALESEDAKHILRRALTSPTRLWPRRALYVRRASVKCS